MIALKWLIGLHIIEILGEFKDQDTKFWELLPLPLL
jgi:hypothetical protein